MLRQLSCRRSCWVGQFRFSAVDVLRQLPPLFQVDGQRLNGRAFGFSHGGFFCLGAQFIVRKHSAFCLIILAVFECHVYHPACGGGILIIDGLPHANYMTPHRLSIPRHQRHTNVAITSRNSYSHVNDQIDDCSAGAAAGSNVQRPNAHARDHGGVSGGGSWPGNQRTYAARGAPTATQLHAAPFLDGTDVLSGSNTTKKRNGGGALPLLPGISSLHGSAQHSADDPACDKT